MSGVLFLLPEEVLNRGTVYLDRHGYMSGTQRTSAELTGTRPEARLTAKPRSTGSLTGQPRNPSTLGG